MMVVKTPSLVPNLNFFNVFLVFDKTFAPVSLFRIAFMKKCTYWFYWSNMTVTFLFISVFHFKPSVIIFSFLISKKSVSNLFLKQLTSNILKNTVVKTMENFMIASTEQLLSCKHFQLFTNLQKWKVKHLNYIFLT